MKNKDIIFILFCIGFIVLFITLGVWQLQRLVWKEELIKDYENKKNLPVESLNIDNSNDKEYWKSRKVTISGTAYPSQIIRITGKMRGRDPGVHIILPVLLDNETVIFLLQGWVPLGYNDEHSAPYQINVLGMLTEYTGPKFSFMPNNIPEKNFWLWPDVLAMSEKLSNDLSGKKVFPLLLKVIDKKANIPKPLEAEIEFRNDHLGYAITWFMVAFATTILTVVYYRRNMSK
jgi:surfeit locus 1 family protein